MSIENLQELIKALTDDGIRTREQWHEWKVGKEPMLTALLQYRPRDDTPKVTQLIAPFWHDTLPLIGLNYTPAAGLSLHHYANGWSSTLRLCRGIVFDADTQELMARPFPKFFNFGEPAAGTMPATVPEVTIKEDGHLIIIFRYGDFVVMTTRGDFGSRTAHIANSLLGSVADNWLDLDLIGTTICAELIHPQTRVGVNYGDRQALIALGCFDNASGRDMPHSELCKVADALGIEAVAKVDKTREELIAVQTSGGSTREGFVARWPDGSRMKFKYGGYMAKVKSDRQARREEQPVAQRIDRRSRTPDVALQRGAGYLRRPV